MEIIASAIFGRSSFTFRLSRMISFTYQYAHCPSNRIYKRTLALGLSLAVNALAQDQEADTAFFSKVRLGMTIDEAGRQKADDVSMLWHSDAPPGQEQVDF